MKTTAKAMSRLTQIGRTYYDPCYWYLPEYLEAALIDPSILTGKSLLHRVQRFVARQQLPRTPMENTGQYITRIRLTRSHNGRLVLIYQCKDLMQDLLTETSTEPSYHRYLDSESISDTLALLNLMEIYISRNRHRKIPYRLKVKLSNPTGHKKSDLIYEYLTQVNDINELFIEALKAGYGISLSRYQIYIAKLIEGTRNLTTVQLSVSDGNTSPHNYKGKLNNIDILNHLDVTN